MFIKRLDNILEKLEQLLLVAAFSILILLMVANILQRNIFNESSQWILEYQPVMVLWISLIGASMALKHGKHISMELVLRFVPEKLRGVLTRLASFFGLIVMAVGLFLSKQFVETEFQLFGNRGYISLIIPIFFACATFRYFTLIIYPVHNAHHINPDQLQK